MRLESITTERNFGQSTDRSTGAQEFRVLDLRLSLAAERLSKLFWLLAEYPCAMPTGRIARASLQGIAGQMTVHQPVNVDAVGDVPSLGTDRARSFGLIRGK